jgi:hypothetical protein
LFDDFVTVVTLSFTADFAAVFATAFTAGFKAGFAAGFAVDFTVVFTAAFAAGLTAVFLVATFATALTVFTGARAATVFTVFALVAEVLTGFCFAFAIGPSTKWGCQCCSGNWSASRCCYFSNRADRTAMCRNILLRVVACVSSKINLVKLR